MLDHIIIINKKSNAPSKKRGPPLTCRLGPRTARPPLLRGAHEGEECDGLLKYVMDSTFLHHPGLGVMAVAVLSSAAVAAGRLVMELELLASHWQLLKSTVE